MSTADTKPSNAKAGDHSDRSGTTSSPVLGIIDALASKRGVDATEIDVSLYESIDPEALELIYRHAQRTETASWTLELTVEGDGITIDSDGRITVQ